MINNPYIVELDKHQDIIIQRGEDNIPFDLKRFTHPERKLILDLGCGAGNFLRDYSQRYPKYNFIGFEIRYKRLVKGALKFKKRSLTNIKLIKDRAESLPIWFAPKSVDEINLNFPDPWANKKRQLKHRLVTTTYLEKIYSILKNGGNFVFKTDHQEYFHWVVNLLKNQDQHRIVELTEDLHNSKLDADNIPTEFELLFKGKNFPVYYLKTKTC